MCSNKSFTPSDQYFINCHLEILSNTTITLICNFCTNLSIEQDLSQSLSLACILIVFLLLKYPQLAFVLRQVWVQRELLASFCPLHHVRLPYLQSLLWIFLYHYQSLC